MRTWVLAYVASCMSARVRKRLCEGMCVHFFGCVRDHVGGGRHVWVCASACMRTCACAYVGVGISTGTHKLARVCACIPAWVRT